MDTHICTRGMGAMSVAVGAFRAETCQIGYAVIDRRWLVSLIRYSGSLSPRAWFTSSSSLLVGFLVCHTTGLWTTSSQCRVREWVHTCAVM